MLLVFVRTSGVLGLRFPSPCLGTNEREHILSRVSCPVFLVFKLFRQADSSNWDIV